MPAEPGFLEVLGWVDLGALIILVFFLVMGIIRGFVWQIAQFVKLIGGFIVANQFSDQVGSWIAGERLAPPYSTYLAYVLLFAGFALLVTLVCVLLEKLLEKAKLKSFDRLLGGGLGLLNGWLLVAAVVLLLYAYPPFLSTKAGISASVAGRGAAQTALLVRGSLPPDIRELLESIVSSEAVDKLADETKDNELPLVIPPSGEPR